MALSSKCAVSLYENVAQLSNLSLKTGRATAWTSSATYRRPAGQIQNLWRAEQHVLKPAVAEINALAPFNVNVLPVKKGKKVVEVRVGWSVKPTGEAQAAFQELNRSKVRGARPAFPARCSTYRPRCHQPSACGGKPA